MGAVEITIIVVAALIVISVAVSAIVRKAKGRSGCSGCRGCAGCPYGSSCAGRREGKEKDKIKKTV